MYAVIYNKTRILATEARQKYGIGLLEPISMDRLYKMSKISCIKKPLESDVSGIFLQYKNTKVVVINTRKTTGHQNFTLAHEFYHSEYDENLESRVCKAGHFDAKNESELLADLFAVQFLMPEEAIKFHLGKRREDISKADLADVIYLEQLFSVSHYAMLVRLQQLKIIDEKSKEKFFPGIRVNARKHGYDDSLYVPSNENVILSDYVEKAQKALGKNLITYSRYEELLLDADLFDVVCEEGMKDYVD
ncbi:ImmA/IrrE family metallo-endopeptidase [Bacillaceae bacterium Marseille-Q3522]|nr:ImmA/IrrE family metallo-endopeptidase [Bacillaceae bacterium Marseille-Q3522]